MEILKFSGLLIGYLPQGLQRWGGGGKDGKSHRKFKCYVNLSKKENGCNSLIGHEFVVTNSKSSFSDHKMSLQEQTKIFLGRITCQSWSKCKL